MELTYYGGGCILLATKQLKVLVDPVSGEYGPNPKLKADVVVLTQQPRQDLQAKADTVITWPGEYEIKSVLIEGVGARLNIEEDTTKLEGVAYAISCGGIRTIIPGNMYPDFSDEQLERLDGADVLVVPVGGHGLTPDKESASKLVRQFDPGFVVPVHYDDGKTDYPVPQAAVSEFLSEVGAGGTDPQSTLKVTSRESAEQTQFAVLEVQ